MSEIVRTDSGDVRGQPREGSTAFRGIPYAAAPVGGLRFAAPVPHPGWEEVRDATENGPTPLTGPTSQETSIPEPTVEGKDILNLNVFTPCLDPAAKLAVYVWIHGGGYTAGTPGGGWFDGDSFNARGVVTVAITYRLGFEGFGHVPGAPDNRAMLDWMAALEWVQRNITAFGGDPEQVTIGGQSAGGGAVLALLASPRAQHLFERVVCHSGPIPDLTTEAARRTGALMAQRCKTTHDVESWRSVPRDQIVAAERSFSGSDLWSGVKDLRRLLGGREPVTTFGPVVDGDVLPRAPLEAFADGVGADKALLIGANSHEFNRATESLEPLLARLAAAPLLTGAGLPATLARGYPRAHPGLTPAQVLGQALTDRLFRISAVRAATAHRDGAAALPQGATPGGTWLYDFRWRSPVTGLSVHCLELPFAWNALGADRVDRIAGPNPPQELADDVHTAVVGLVRDGDPGWEQFSRERSMARVFDVPSWTGRDPYRFERVAADLLDGR